MFAVVTAANYGCFYMAWLLWPIEISRFFAYIFPRTEMKIRRNVMQKEKKEKEVKKGRHSRVFLSEISLLYVVNQIRKKLPCFTKARKAEDPRLRHSGMTPLFNCGAFTLPSSSRSVSVRDISDGVGMRAFTLIELLVVVLIIGILAAIALPQYQKAVDKSRVATMLPLMRRWVDAMALYKLEHGSYTTKEGIYDISPTGEELGVTWPSDWECSGRDIECWNELWYCFANEEFFGEVWCSSLWKSEDENFDITITQPDDFSNPAGKRYCRYNESFCKALGGKEIPGYEGYYEF
jgi:prepilin-type N-terminal cleavage/methylation domain-containing protein